MKHLPCYTAKNNVSNGMVMQKTGNCETMIPNAFHQNFYLKNTFSLRIIRKNDVHSNGTNIFYRLTLKK